MTARAHTLQQRSGCIAAGTAASEIFDYEPVSSITFPFEEIAAGAAWWRVGTPHCPGHGAEAEVLRVNSAGCGCDTPSNSEHAAGWPSTRARERAFDLVRLVDAWACCRSQSILRAQSCLPNGDL